MYIKYDFDSLIWGDFFWINCLRKKILGDCPAGLPLLRSHDLNGQRCGVGVHGANAAGNQSNWRFCNAIWFKQWKFAVPTVGFGKSAGCISQIAFVYLFFCVGWSASYGSSNRRIQTQEFPRKITAYRKVLVHIVTPVVTLIG